MKNSSITVFSSSHALRGNSYISLSAFNYGEYTAIITTKLVEFNYFSKKNATFGIKTNLHATKIAKKGYSVVKDNLTTAKNNFIYNNMSCQGILDNSILGEVRG